MSQARAASIEPYLPMATVCGHMLTGEMLTGQMLTGQLLTGQMLTPLSNKKLSYCWETVRRESMPRIAEMDVEMTT